LHRGIACGAIVDPWSILGFQGQYPLFQAREDAIPDQRIETLLEFVERYFEVSSRALSQASASGDNEAARQIKQEFETQAKWWDQFASTTVSDLPRVHGGEALESACAVADALAEWRTAGESSGDISFWREHVGRFQSPRAFGRVVETLLQKTDHVAAMGLLIAWLGQAEEVGLSSGGYSFSDLLLKWVRDIAAPPRDRRANRDEVWRQLRRLFDYLEANAGEFWSAPKLDDSQAGNGSHGKDDESDALLTAEDDDWETDDSGDLFEAAYEGVVYRDSAEDGNPGETLDDGYVPRDTEIEILSRDMEPRLEFLKALGDVWQQTAEVLAAGCKRFGDEESAAVSGWIQHSVTLQKDLGRLLKEVTDYSLGTPTGTPESNLEYDIQFQARLYLQHKVVAAISELNAAEWALRALLPRARFPEEKSAKAKTRAQTQRTAEIVRCVLQQDRVSLRRRLPLFLKALRKQPLLYVSLENDGDPRRFLAARAAQRVLTFLLTNLPRMGLLYETWQVLVCAFRMERSTRPGGTATTEFDRLLQTALTGSLECVVRSSKLWPKPVATSRRRFASLSREPGVAPRRRPGGKRSRRSPASRPSLRARRNRPADRFGSPSSPRRERSATDLTSGRELQRITRREHQLRRLSRTSGGAVLLIVKSLVERYATIWLKHSRSVRLSPAEVLLDNSRWSHVKKFIENYGHDLLHAPMLMLSNVRAILHQGVDVFLEYLEEEQDPLHPIPLLEDIEEGVIEREEACRLLELIYETILDKLDCFVEYNTTTTQSDYGEMFYCLLDFLRVEAEYDRDAWNVRPDRMAHQVLSDHGSPELARKWQRHLRDKTHNAAEKHLQKLRKLEKRYSVRLPSVSDHLEERFVKVMAVDRMRALIAPALAEAQSGDDPPRNFLQLWTEIDRYLESTAGSAIEVPEWLAGLDREVRRINDGAAHGDENLPSSLIAEVPVSLRPRQMIRQLSKWQEKRRQRL